MLTQRELWETMARSRLNVIRLGLHDCIPWRMAGALAIGACVALDQAPQPRWPEPLREHLNFLDLGAATDQAPVATEASYEHVPEKVEGWLRESETFGQIARANASYFDRYGDPPAVGASILDAIPSG
jgi:hypothetical protein